MKYSRTSPTAVSMQSASESLVSVALDAREPGSTAFAGVERRSALLIPEALRALSDAFYNSVETYRPSLFRRFVYRTFDIVVASIAIVLLAPVFLALAVLIRFDSKGPILYRQTRVGLNGRLFRCHKFRTMWVDADKRLNDLLAASSALRVEYASTFKLREDPRITRIGRQLRRTSLDELPQLFNVLGGSMSLVGPRPVVPIETSLYGSSLRELLAVRPGLTGPWQVSGRNDLPYAERCHLDIAYCRDHSLWGDIKLLLKTVLVVIHPRGNGAY